MKTLTPDLGKQLERIVIEVREVAESGSRDALEVFVRRWARLGREV